MKTVAQLEQEVNKLREEGKLAVFLLLGMLLLYAVAIAAVVDYLFRP